MSGRKILKFPHCVFPIRLPRSVGIKSLLFGLTSHQNNLSEKTYLHLVWDSWCAFSYCASYCISYHIYDEEEKVWLLQFYPLNYGGKFKCIHPLKYAIVVLSFGATIKLDKKLHQFCKILRPALHAARLLVPYKRCILKYLK